MTRTATRPPWPTPRSARWGSGLVLWCYVAQHLGNHASGLVSLDLANTLRGGVSALWHSLPGTALLYGAALTHVVLACAAVWQRRRLRMPWVEALRLALGLCVPLLLVGHFVGTRWAFETMGAAPSYEHMARALARPENLVPQMLLLVMAWTHGCLGLHMALRMRPGWQRWQPVLLTGAVLLPVLAALGLLSMARELASHLQAWPTPPSGRTAQAAADASRLTDWLRWGWAAALLALLASRWAWHTWRQQRGGGGHITLHYPDRAVQVPRGFTVLEASRAQGIAHLSLCGGRARCSTCRVRVDGPAVHLPAPGPDERATLLRVQAPPGVRLACQLRPQGDLRVTPLFQPSQALPSARLGEERQVAILFVDLRRWSGIAERQWPFDLAWMLDQYFGQVGAAVQDSGGMANQFIGDSVMAIFGLDTDLATACQQAVQAAVLIEQRMDAWSKTLDAQFGLALDFGMGLHAGRVALGRVGYEDTTTFTAVGEVVNTASRLQDHSKVVGARLVMSLQAARLAGVADVLGAPEQVQVRGRSVPLQVLHVKQPSRLWGKSLKAAEPRASA
ncbi:adenylate/guanylate cyclase domain-containing protein [Acidovorax radicis]|uniref:adenylate/guanylate cyclase domain-containing protein n=1 Tax=Acidovorax radicis TaxID=758826 RepID=UPI001CF923D5|nr:adenylate/guanylate cyclase domain-containing protein [Acidovorax radicis]UCU99073.1 adenylate/guanylate cyclase domain-containing protein [Acidovorax radicis]